MEMTGSDAAAKSIERRRKGERADVERLELTASDWIDDRCRRRLHNLQSTLPSLARSGKVDVDAVDSVWPSCSCGRNRPKGQIRLIKANGFGGTVRRRIASAMSCECSQDREKRCTHSQYDARKDVSRQPIAT